MKTIGDKIRELRESKKISQEKLAEYIGVSRQSIHKWENGESQLNTNNLKSLCDYFKVSSEYFINESVTLEEIVVADNTTIFENGAVVNHKQKQAKKNMVVSVIVIIIISLALICSISFTVGTGCIVFTNNLGKEYLSILEVQSYSFYLFLIMSLILLALDVIVILFIKKSKSKV